LKSHFHNDLIAVKQQPFDIMHTLFGKARDLPPALLSALATYRRKACVGRPGSMPDAAAEDADRFDSGDMVYVVARDDSGRICGSAGLSPAPGTSLLNDAFPDALAHRGETWELSHFAVDPVSAGGCARSLLAAAATAASEQGARRLITVSPAATERLFHRLGVHAHRAGPPALVNGAPLFACWIEIDERTAGALGLATFERRVRPHAKRFEPSLHLPGLHCAEEEHS
jgi:acyl homoserine lactone synthase